MNSVSDTHVLMRQPLVAEELRKWPLMHGTDRTGQELEQIRREGLVAGSASNSQDYDRELGRTDFVFLTLASFLVNYGWCAILVDSAVLERKDLGFSDQDVRVAIDCLKILIEDGRDVYCGEAKNVDGLYRIVEAQRGATSDANGEQLFAKVICSPEFKTHYHQHYELSEVDFWQHVQKAYKGRLLYDFFCRSNDPWLQEEISVPKVEPELLLGYWDGSHWVEWRKASTPDVQHRLQAWIDTATSRSTQ
jgi:hypothetical protein